MDIKERAKSAFEFVASIPTDIADTTYNFVNTIYYTATGHTLGKPLHSKVLVNNITKKLVNRKVFSDIPTDDELKNPDIAKNYFLKAVRKNDNELMEITLQHSFNNPKSAETVLKTADEDLLMKVYAISKGKASAKDGIVASRELSLLSQLTKDPNVAKMLPFTTKFKEKINNEEWLKKHPEYRAVKEVLDKYHTINKTLDMINLLSFATFGAGKIGAKVFKTPLLKAVSHVISTTSIATPLATGVYRASINQESLSHAISPLDALMIGDVIREGKAILKTKDMIITHEIYKQLKDPNFDPTEHILTQLSKKYDLSDKELSDFKLAIMTAERKEFKKSETFYKALSKNIGEKYTAILKKVLSRKNFEEELLQNDKYIIQAFLEHKPLREYFIKNYSKDGKIVIDDINKVEEDLFEMAKSDPVIANFMKYNRQKRLLGELIKAIEHGNKEITLSILRPATNNEEIPTIEDRVIDLTQPLKSILDEAEKEFTQNATISITYKTKAGDVISRTIKPFYAPSNDEFRVLKGKFQVLKDGEWQEIEDLFTIPLSRTHEIETALKEIAREKGYADIKLVEGEVEYIKPATNIFPHKLIRLSNKIQQIEEKFLKTNEKVKSKEIEEFRKLVEEAYENGYLPPVIKQKIGDKEIDLTAPLDYYLQMKPQEVFKIIKSNIIQHTKDIISRNKEASGIFKEVIYDESGSLLKLVENELKEYENIIKGMTEDIKDIKGDILSKSKTFVKDEITLQKELLQTINDYVKTTGKSLKQINKTAKNIKDKIRDYIKEETKGLTQFTNYELNNLLKASQELRKVEELSEKVKNKKFRDFYKLLKDKIKETKIGVKGYGLIGEETLKEISNLDTELKNAYNEIKNSVANIFDLLKTKEGISKLNKSDLLKSIEEDLKLLNESLQKLNTSDLYNSIKGFFETAKESYKDYALQIEKIEAKIKDLSNLAKVLSSAEKVSLRDNIKLTDLIDKSAMRLDAVADTIKKIATTPYYQQRRQGSGFATVFDSYESFKDYASLKYLASTFQYLKASSFLYKFAEELEELEKRNPHGLNPTQKLMKNFLNLYLNRDMTDFAKAQRMLGNLITLLNPSIALGNFVASLQSLHALFPSLDIMKIGEIKSVWNREFRKMLFSEGLYKFNILNPFYVSLETILKSHVIANLKNDEIFNNVILDYAKQIGIEDEKIIESIRAYYKDRREELAEDIINHISGLDVGVMQNLAIEYGKLGESLMPWYRFIFTPLSVATEIIKTWKNAPEYIKRLGVGKTFGKALAFSVFSAIALGSQAVPFLAPAETTYSLAKTFINTLAVALGDDEVFTDKNFSELVLRELDYHFLKTGLFDPNERVNFYTSFGTALLQAIAGAEAQGWDTNPFIHYFRVGLDFLSKVGASGLISASAGSYVADIPAPALTIIQNIVRKNMYATDEQTKQTQTILAILQSIPLTNNIYKEIAGKTLVKGIGEGGKEEIWQPSIPQEILSKEGQGVVGLAHLIGFMLMHADAIFNSYEIQKATDLFRYELATNEEKRKMFSPIKSPAGVEHYKLLNFGDYNVFRNSPDEIITTLRYIPEEEMPKVKEKADKLMINNLKKLAKLLKEGEYTDKTLTEIKHRYEALQNYIIVADYLDWDKLSDMSLNDIRQLNQQIYKILQSKGIDVDYKDIVRIKRKLESGKIGA